MENYELPNPHNVYYMNQPQVPVMEPLKIKRTLRWKEDALEQNPGDPEICYHLGMAHLAADHPETARHLFTYAMYFDNTRTKHGARITRLMGTSKNSF